MRVVVVLYHALIRIWYLPVDDEIDSCVSGALGYLVT